MSRNTSQFVKEFYERIWNAGDLDAVDELLSLNFSFRGSLGPQTHSREAFRAYVKEIRAYLSEYRCEILDCVTEGEKAFAKIRFSGIPFSGYQPSGKSVRWPGAALLRVQHQRIAELWELGDLASLNADLLSNAAS